LSILFDCGARRVVVVDDLSGTFLNKEQLSHWQNTFEVIITDFCHVDLAGRKFDDIFHLASLVGFLGIIEYTGQVAQNDTDIPEPHGGELIESIGPYWYIIQDLNDVHSCRESCGAHGWVCLIYDFYIKLGVNIICFLKRCFFNLSRKKSDVSFARESGARKNIVHPTTSFRRTRHGASGILFGLQYRRRVGP